MLCLFYFYHHPHHIGIIVNKKSHTHEEGFFMDSMGTNLLLSATQLNKNKKTATLYEIFKFKE